MERGVDVRAGMHAGLTPEKGPPLPPAHVEHAFEFHRRAAGQVTIDGKKEAPPLSNPVRRPSLRLLPAETGHSEILGQIIRVFPLVPSPSVAYLRFESNVHGSP